MADKVKFTLNPNLRPFWQKQSRFKLLKGGRGSSKTVDATAVLVLLSTMMKLRIICARQFMASLSTSLKPEIEQRIEDMGFDGEFDIQKTCIINKHTKSEFLFFGIARNISEIKGTSGVDILLIEEAAKLTKDQFDTIYPTVRKDNSEIWVLWNPDEDTDFINQLVLDPPDDCLIRHINYDENPNLPKILVDQIKSDKRRLPPEDFAHIWLGVPKSDNQLAFIKANWLRACIDSHIVLNRPGIASGAKRVGFDIADAGKDTSAVSCATGNFLESVEEWKSNEGELLISTQKAYGIALEFGGVLVPDVIGIGASALPKIAEMNVLRTARGLPTVDSDKFHAGESPSETPYQNDILCCDHFANLKAEAWAKLSDRARNTFVLRTAIERGDAEDELPLFEDYELFSISSDIECMEKLISELSSPRKLINEAGMTACEGKKDMLKRHIRSPNIADSVVIAMYKENGAGFFDGL